MYSISSFATRSAETAFWLLLFVVIANSGCRRPVTSSAEITRITYVDATDGPNGNTKLASGETFSAWTGSPVRDDNLWTLRPHGNGATVFTSNDIQGTGSEDAPALITTISGLEPRAKYEIFAYFWSDRHNWQLNAALEPFPTSGSGLSFSKDGSESSTSAKPADEADFDPAPLVKESNRTLFQAKIGEAFADKNGEIPVWIDDNPNSPEQQRTWYDGLGFRPTGEKLPATRTLAIVLIIGAIAVILLVCLVLSWFRRNRKNSAALSDAKQHTDTP